MRLLLVLLLVVTAMSVHSQTIYVVRHAEKAVVAPDASQMMKSDPPLSDAGEARAQKLAGIMKDKWLTEIWSTPYQRTRATVAPSATLFSLAIQEYSPRPDSTKALLQQLKSRTSGNILITGHSNTVDDIVNGITGEASIPGDLDDSEYDNLFILKKEGDRFVFERIKY